MLVACIFTIKVNKLIYKYIYEYLVHEMLKSARYDIDRAEIVVHSSTSKGCHNSLSANRKHQVADDSSWVKQGVVATLI